MIFSLGRQWCGRNTASRQPEPRPSPTAAPCAPGSPGRSVRSGTSRRWRDLSSSDHLLDPLWKSLGHCRSVGVRRQDRAGGEGLHIGEEFRPSGARASPVSEGGATLFFGRKRKHGSAGRRFISEGGRGSHPGRGVEVEATRQPGTPFRFARRAAHSPATATSASPAAAGSETVV